MKRKVAELEGALLDAAVAKCEGWRFEIAPARPAAGGVVAREALCLATVPDLEHGDGNGLVGWDPSTSWEYGGPIIERECIQLIYREEGDWSAIAPSNSAKLGPCGYGSTPLIAAMSAYVASKFGEEVEL